MWLLCLLEYRKEEVGFTSNYYMQRGLHYRVDRHYNIT